MTETQTPASSAAPPASDGSVRLRGVTKAYAGAKGHPEVAAVKGIDLEIRNGELMVLVGPSGCGKSTTLRLIAGLETASSGTIEIGGRVVNDVEPKDRGIAMVFQNYALYPHMTVFENLAFGLKMARKPKPEVRESVLRAADALGLEKLLARKPQALSGGQRQRVALGRALVRNPKVFLFDEPLSNLDAQMRVQMRAEIARLHNRLKTTMIYVTHDQVEAMTLGDRICVMHDGVIRQVADPLTLYRQPRNVFVVGFIGSPPMNLLTGRLESREGGMWFVEKGGPNPLAVPLAGETAKAAPAWVDREVVLGLRPEHLADETGAGFTASLSVEFVERMGAESVIHLQTAGSGLLVRARGEHFYKAGELFTVRFDAKQALLFDGQSGERLA